MASEVAERLHRLFVEFGYQWKISGELATPTAKDLDTAIDSAKEVLYTEPVPSQVEVGRLIIRRYTPDTYDVYLQIGEIND